MKLTSPQFRILVALGLFVYMASIFADSGTNSFLPLELRHWEEAANALPEDLFEQLSMLAGALSIGAGIVAYAAAFTRHRRTGRLMLLHAGLWLAANLLLSTHLNTGIGQFAYLLYVLLLGMIIGTSPGPVSAVGKTFRSHWHQTGELLRRRGGTEIYGAIRQVLFWHWDPINVRGCVKGEDEYDAYIGPVYRLLSSGASDRQVEEYLRQTEGETMGLSVPSVSGHLAEVIKLLRAIDLKAGEDDDPKVIP